MTAGVFFAALIASGCAGSFPTSREEGDATFRVSPLEASSPGCVPGPATDVVEALAAAGGGRPRTGYVGLGAALYFARNRDLSGGWGLDLSYVQNITGVFSVEGSLGTVSYDLEAAAEKGSLNALTLGIVAQYGRPFGTSRWYVGGGGAWWLNETTGLGGLDADDAPAWIVEGGVEFSVSPHANLDLEFRYTFAKSELENGDDLDLDAFAARVNYVFIF